MSWNCRTTAFVTALSAVLLGAPIAARAQTATIEGFLSDETQGAEPRGSASSVFQCRCESKVSEPEHGGT
jgi:hypothetical protein